MEIQRKHIAKCSIYKILRSYQNRIDLYFYPIQRSDVSHLSKNVVIGLLINGFSVPDANSFKFVFSDPTQLPTKRRDV